MDEAGWNDLANIVCLQCFLWNWNPWGDSILDPYQALMVERMHQMDLGILEHTRGILNANCEENTLQLLNSRLESIRWGDRWSGFRLPQKGYFGNVSYITAAEHRHVFEVIVPLCWGVLGARNMKLLRAVVEWERLTRQIQFTEVDLEEMRILISR